MRGGLGPMCGRAGRCSLIGHGPGAVEGIEDETVKGLVALNAAIILPVIELEWILWDGFDRAGYALEPIRAAQSCAFDVLKLRSLPRGIDRHNIYLLRPAKRLGLRPAPEVQLSCPPRTLSCRHLADRPM